MPIIDIQDTNFIHRTQGTLEPNLLPWTRDSFVLLWPTVMKHPLMVSFILAILQTSLSTTVDIGSLVNFRTYSIIFSSSVAAAISLMLSYGYDWYRHRQGPSISAKKMVVVFMGSILIGLFSIASSLIALSPFLGIFLLFALLTPVWWVNAPRIYYSRQRVFVSRGL